MKHCSNPDCAGLARDGVVAEFRDTVSHCLDCGEPLALGERPAAVELATEYVELVTIFIAADFSQGHLVAGAVEAAGIPVFLKGEHLVGAVGELPTTVSQLEVQVPIEREDDAREIAMAWERPAGGDGGEPGSAGESPDPVHGVVVDALARETETD